MIDNRSNLICPSCYGEIEPHDNDMECLKCHKKYDIINGIPIMVNEESCGENKDMNQFREDIHIKNNVRNLYSNEANKLNSRIYGRFSMFMNNGYIANENKQYAKFELKNNIYQKNSVKLLLEVIGNIDCNNKQIIEIGCGRGGNIYYINSFFKPQLVVGIDLCIENLSFCNKKKLPNTTFYVADAERIPFASESFDIAVNIESSIHYPSIMEFFNNIYRILKKGGYFLYTDILSIQKFELLRKGFIELGFEIIRDQNITSNTLLSIESTKARNLNYTDGMNENLFLNFFSNQLYKNMIYGKDESHIIVLKKI